MPLERVSWVSKDVDTCALESGQEPGRAQAGASIQKGAEDRVGAKDKLEALMAIECWQIQGRPEPPTQIYVTRGYFPIWQAPRPPSRNKDPSSQLLAPSVLLSRTEGTYYSSCTRAQH